MKIRYICGICLVCSLLLVAKSQGRSSPRIFFVGDGGEDCLVAHIRSIQTAIDRASSGDLVKVCNGTYKETLRISKSITVEAAPGAFLVPDTVPQNSESLTTGEPIAAAVYVSSAKDVRISGLTIDGARSAIKGCGPNLVGVYFQNSSGHIENLRIKNFRLGPGLAGCQSGTGIFVQSGNGGTSAVEINNCVLHDFQKNGITADEVGTTVQIHDNIINGIGPTTGAAQNGIEMGFGAQGKIVHNTISNEVWSPCTNDDCAGIGTGILINESDYIVVERNRISLAQIGIFVVGNQTMLDSNHVNDSPSFDGIRIIGEQNVAKSNEIVTSGEAGIFLQGSDNRIESNTVTDSPIGFIQTPDSRENQVLYNDFFATPIPLQPFVLNGMIELL